MDDPWQDAERHTHPLEGVERYDGGYEISFDRGMTTIITDKRNTVGVEPRVGDAYTYWGRGFGSRHRGQAVNGQVIWYLTEEEDRRQFHAEVEASRAKRRAEWEDGKVDYFARIAVLPDVFRERIAVRQRNNPDFDWEYGLYELFCCEQALLIASTLKMQDAVREFYDLSWDEQLALVPGLSDQHSGNTFGAACTLAEWYLVNPSQVGKVRGALSPLVGSCAYGDVPPSHAFCHKDTQP